MMDESQSAVLDISLAQGECDFYKKSMLSDDHCG